MKNEFDKFNLSKEIINSLSDLGYKKPTEVQDLVIKEALLNKDLIVKAQTGSGKTAAFGIPLCEKIDWEENTPQALILAPTRELAMQIKDDIINIGRYKRIKAIALVGKESFKEQEKALKGKVHVVVGTPGRILDHLDNGNLNGKAFNYLVIDEADEMFNMGFIGQVEGVCRRITRKRVTMLFSATMPEKINELSNKHMDRPIEIKIKAQSLITDKITHELVKVEGKDKLNKANEILLKEGPETAIMFCRTKDNVEAAFKYFKDKGYSVDKIHGDMLQKDRTKKMNEFKEGKFRILIATDIAARGIDVDNITHVINIDIPVEKEAYVHRIGRTGRAGTSGKSITFITPYENKYLDRIEEYIGFKINNYNEVEDSFNIKDRESLLRSKPVIKKSTKKITKNITKIYLNGGKKKKIRVIDIVGTIMSIEGIDKEDIGIIDVKDMGSTVEILNNKGRKVLDALRTKTIKGKTLRVEIAKK
ncbi:DEAD/DEAH box helicase [Clostridium sardiniense]|uniref:DEAD/DEAH box helicase n=1 Tax=Clostridium sardiniense TaxID=29369 RepID=A0ABS7KZK9_CLOSR|nr:DEAD/DEAH box helicase [Clostridium sardiniense]MBY0756246.1 DEAD/DEAH box helicase [Clostridium sardiniense]MDQ0458810.1 superfamily II DNA/RNA helicase [Clostridium sardiniense]